MFDSKLKGVFALMLALLVQKKAVIKRGILDGLKQAAKDYQGFQAAGMSYVKGQAKAEVDWDPNASGLARAGQNTDLVGVMLTIIIAAVIGYVGLTVMSKTEDTTSFTANSAFDNSSTDLDSAVETVYSLVEVVFIALFLSLIIGALLFLRQR